MYRLLIYAASTLLLLVLGACVSGGGLVRAGQDPLVRDAQLRDTLAQLDAMATPQGADPATFAMLKLELRAMLIARSAGKLTTAAPSTIRSKVTDLNVLSSLSGTRFTWTYKNEGDYNQNGTVNISDMAILGIHYGKDASSSDWATAKLADGNVDGQINIGDLASIGIGFGRVITRYVLEYSTESGTSAVWSMVDEVLLAESEVDLDRLRKFDHYLPSQADGYYRVVPYHMELSGIPSDPLAWGLEVPGDWCMYGHDPQHTHRSRFIGPETNAVKWTFTTGAYVDSTPTLAADGTIYFGSGDGNIYAVNGDGSLKWSYTTGSYVASSAAIGADGTVYIGGGDGKIYALNTNGSLKWSYTTGDQVPNSPMIGVDGTIYIGSHDGLYYAMNPDGSLKWSYAPGGSASFHTGAAAVGADGTLYHGIYGKLLALNPDGSLRWSYPLTAWCETPSIGTDGTIYVGSMDHNLYAFNPDGSIQWICVLLDQALGSVALGADGTVYIRSIDNNLYAVNPNGTVKWTNYLWGAKSSPALDAQGTVYCGGKDNCFYALRDDGNMKWTYSSASDSFSIPAIGADGTLYVGNRNGMLYAFGPGGT